MNMAIYTRNSSIVLVIFSISALFLLLHCNSSSDRVAELLELQARSESGVIHMDDHSVKRFISSVKIPRPYFILLFFDAVQLHEKSELRLQDLRSEFALLSSSFIFNNKGTPSESGIFFCDIEYKDSQSTFLQFGINSLPHIRLISPHVKNLKDSEAMDQSDFSRLSESMADYVESKTKLSVGPIQRPPMFSRKQIAFFGIAILIWAPFALKKILSGKTLLHDSKTWLVFAVFIYFFSVSGTMHNIIRKLPLYMADRENPSRMVFFYQGSGMQLGVEGFAVGFLYTIVGLLLAFVTHILPKIESLITQRLIMILALCTSFWAVHKVIYLDNWKTGYGVHAYWPSSWK